MSDIPITTFTCGPSTPTCKCQCPKGPCEHVWDGPWVEFDNTVTVTCSRCRLSSFTHSMWVGP